MHALIIDDIAAHATLAATHLQRAGWQQIEHVPSLAAGVVRAEQRCALYAPADPLLVLVDVMLPHPRCPDLEALGLVAYLVDRMCHHALRPVPIVAITGQPTPERAYEFRCLGVPLLAKPFTEVHARHLARLMRQPAMPGQLITTAVDEPAAQLRTQLFLRRTAQQQIQLIRTLLDRRTEPPAPPSWSSDQAWTVLEAPSQLLADARWAAWIDACGGVQAARSRLIAHLTSSEARRFAQALVQHGDNRRAIMHELGIARATYFRLQAEVRSMLAVPLAAP